MSLVLTRTQNLREQSAGLYQWVDRPSNYGAMDHFMDDTTAPNSLLSPSLRSTAWKSIGSTLQAPAFDSSTVSISSSRSATISDAELTSSMISFTFVTYSWGFTQVVSDFHNNELDAQANFNQQYIRYANAFHAAVDTACVAKLATGKTQVFSYDPTLLNYAVNSNVVTADYAMREELIGDIDALMMGNDIGGRLHLIGNPGFKALVQKMNEKGLYNEVNKKIQYADKTLHFTNRISNADNMYATFYALPMGSTGLLFRVEREALYQPANAIGYEWGTDTMLGSGIPIGTYAYQSVGDQSARTGAASGDNTRALKQHFGWSVDICYVTSHNSDAATYSNPIIAAQIAKAP